MTIILYLLLNLPFVIVTGVFIVGPIFFFVWALTGAAQHSENYWEEKK